MNLQLTKAQGETLARVEALYQEAFPANERKPFALLVKLSQTDALDILALHNGSVFCGLAIAALHADLALLDYFAIDPALRGQGLGGAALQLIRQRYPDKRLFLEIEAPDAQAANNAQRLKRLAFYQRNRFRDSGLHLTLNGVDMIMLTQGETIEFSEYLDLYRRVFGPAMAKLVVRREVSP